MLDFRIKHSIYARVFCKGNRTSTGASSRETVLQSPDAHISNCASKARKRQGWDGSNSGKQSAAIVNVGARTDVRSAVAGCTVPHTVNANAKAHMKANVSVTMLLFESGSLASCLPRPV